MLILLQVHALKTMTIIIAIVVCLAAAVAFFMHRFERAFEQDAQEALDRSISNPEEPISLLDLEQLPPPVRRFMIHAGVVGKGRVRNFYIRFDGEMRGKGKDWFSFHSRQYNTLEPATRLFYMEARLFGMTVPGYHKYGDGKASMDVKLFGLIPLVSHHEREMFKTETVTFLNDVCLFAPSALLGKSFQWEAIDSSSAKLSFTNGDATVHAILYFNEAGELIDFVSNDRMDVNEMKTYRFSTPAGQYRDVNGFMLPGYGEAIWHYPDGPFTYGKFRVKEVTYNVDPVQHLRP
jgi:hypothetical protein